MQLPAGSAGPFAIEAPARPGQTATALLADVAIYDWTTGTWRQLLAGTSPTRAAVTPIEAENGFLRIRLPTDSSIGRLSVVNVAAAG